MIIGRGNLKLDNTSIISRAYDFLNNYNLHDFDMQYGQLGGRLSSVVMAMYLYEHKLLNLMPQYWEEFKPLTTMISSQCNNKNIIFSWFNILPTGTALPAHNHKEGKNRGCSYGTFVYYPNLIDGDISIELFKDDTWIPIHAQTGDWIWFDLDCVHRVPINNTDHHRISFAFDL
jgi:hypothetical protein